ncbi:sulfatase [Roseibacillus persicicus]|uniref:sulfatase n=1 Tax=Roseibacillus persicicus TaxID=454148 RepID=UPI00280D95E6|nr:sulfatase [Roseibacillus persicicus]MDQ8188766.1 sulfatase [Roseibacillus persicicus]
MIAALRTLFFLGLAIPVLSKPNVLLISIDDLNDWVGCLQGHPQARTPNIDRLAKSGTLFANAHCQAPVCNPSRASLMTGRYPHSSGVYFLTPDLKKAPALRDLPTLPEVFAKEGYRTLAAGKLFHGHDQRYFQEYGGNMGGFGPRPAKKLSQPHGHPLWDWGAFPEKDEEMPDEKVADWAIEQLGKKHETPFLMGVGFWRPHVPMYAPQKWFDLFPREQIQLPKVRENDLADISPYARNLTTLNHVAPTHSWMTTAGQWKHAVQAYLASIAFADHQVGRVLDALEASPHRDNTIVVLFSDHGFHLGEKERWAKRSLWEDGTRVPLIISAPGYQGDKVSARPAELLDIFPTLLELASLPAVPKQEGQSLVPLLEDPQAAWQNPALTSFGPGNIAIRTQRMRYIRYADGSEELYDHRTDPDEHFNLLHQSPVSPSDRKLADELASHLPEREAPLLPGKSTGHEAFRAANHARKLPTGD